MHAMTYSYQCTIIFYHVIWHRTPENPVFCLKNLVLYYPECTSENDLCLGADVCMPCSKLKPDLILNHQGQFSSIGLVRSVKLCTHS